tara:strand:- start:1825 stop:1992 length:168 start_codon:yes stop_codon:yes gene_type:complete
VKSKICRNLIEEDLYFEHGHFSSGIEEHYRQAERRPQDEMLNACLRWEKFVGASE